MTSEYLCSLLKNLVNLPHETEWVEFKLNNTDPAEIGEYISAISNSAALQNKQVGYIVWGIENETHDILGTTFKPKAKKIGEQELENWIATQLEPRIDYPKYFELTEQKLPTDLQGILQRLASENIIITTISDTCEVTNLGAILFAKNLSFFKRLSRKTVRVIMYEGKNRLKTLREMQEQRGYAAAFESLIGYINNLLPQNEVINESFRSETRMYPEIAIRELVANALIHQDFDISGTGPMIEIFSDRIEITNPGTPLIEAIRFIDQPPRSRNESLAAFMRRINVCEERGSGIDKVINAVEVFQLPAPSFKVTDNHTQVTLFAYKKLTEMDKDDKIRACYQHACLKFVSNEQMTNSSLRKRFSILSKNTSIASRIIADTVDSGWIKPYDPSSESKKHARYVPFWA